MRVQIIVTDADGKSYQGEAQLIATTAGAQGRKRKSAKPRKAQHTTSTTTTTATTAANFDFSLPVRAFMNRYARSLAGPKKLTFLVARLTGGELTQRVAGREVEREWNRMTEVMGGDFNNAYASRARTQGWIDIQKRPYFLLKDWPQAAQS